MKQWYSLYSLLPNHLHFHRLINRRKFPCKYECSIYMYKDSVCTSQRTESVTIIRASSLLMFREILADYCKNHTKHINRVCRQNDEILILYQVVPLAFKPLKRCIIITRTHVEQ